MSRFITVVLIGLLFPILPLIAEDIPLTPEDKLDYGILNGNTYNNTYFGVTITVPAGWNIQDTETTAMMRERGKAMLAGDDGNFKALLDASDVTSAMLLTVFKHPLGAPVVFNPGFVFVAEKVVNYPGIKTGADYLAQMRLLMGQSQVQYVFDEGVTSEMIGGMEFTAQTGSITIGQLKVTQKFYVSITKGYALSFILSYQKPEEKAELEAFSKTIVFDQSKISKKSPE